MNQPPNSQIPMHDSLDEPMFESDESQDIADSDGGDGDGDVDGDSDDFTPSVLQDDHLAMDSYGRFRYVGGAPNKLLIDAVRATSKPAESPQGPSLFSPSPMREKYTTAPLPFFTPGIVWPSLPYIPQPEQVPLPPRYIADVLVNLYFDQVQCIFPVLYRPRFMNQYQDLMNNSSSRNSAPEFLSVFFAVCAYSSSLMDPSSGQRFSGIEYYEKAVVLHCAGTGRSSIEQVQGLALLSLCASRWNTLAQGWKFAGQAVRAAQDLGLHVGLVSLFCSCPPSAIPAISSMLMYICKCPIDDNMTEPVAREQGRRTWWTVATLDCILSLCLGRPMIGLDLSNTCPLPMDLIDEDLEAYAENPEGDDFPSSDTAPLVGFIAFARLCVIFMKIYRLHQQERHNRQTRNIKRRQLARTKRQLLRKLEEWKTKLSSSVAFSSHESCTTASAAHRAMSVIISVVYSAAAQVKSRIPLVPLAKNFFKQLEAVLKHRKLYTRTYHPAIILLSASTSFPYLDFYCILRATAAIQPPPDIVEDVTSCVKLLTELETYWPPAQRSRAILQDLLCRTTDSSADRSIIENLEELQNVEALFPSLDPALLPYRSPLSIGNILLHEGFTHSPEIVRNEPNGI
ncbi:fungal specific transcription factor domain-containing protein [Pochonia chlamydosporia 170]|uniref:Fungal specific transcription factor domain-containing protein n=1 Tax=Pochonia chlamydosporia 170 TaxID=1380566 RepID=A0A179F1K3_METCM|nr:fungal specific transcription factor domain-containing protein [Pochonia chlamydosporia 170]OAQ59150.2 fungal specific transcription factor domain-containing protein [Pochonia chlamydosporia 170]